MILLDTNVISETMRPNPDPQVLMWLDSLDLNEAWTCSIVVGELYSGAAQLAAGRRSRALCAEIENLVTGDLRGQVLDFDLEAARQYGEILANRKTMGRPIHELDAQIAAIASVHKAALATRNTRDFEHCGVKLINPWETQR